MERLQKVIANLGYCSRRHAEELIVSNKVKVNGNIVNELGSKVKKGDTIEVEGNILDNNKNYEYYLLNKPREVISAASDDKGRKTVIDLINTDSRIYPIGRLDYDTTGIILLTNDGELANLLMHPSSKIDKVYVARINGVLTGKDINILKNGVVIDGRKTSKARVKVKSIDKKMNKSSVEITIHEGRNHQVRKMFETLGYEVVKLKREKYANLDLTKVKVGEYRKLSFKEVTTLYSLCKKKKDI